MATITKDSPRSGDYYYDASDFPLGGELIVEPGAYVDNVGTNPDGVDNVEIKIGGGIDVFVWYGARLFIDISSTGFISTTFAVLAARADANLMLNDGYIGGGLYLSKFIHTQSDYDAMESDSLVNSGTITISRSGEAAVDVDVGTVTNTGLISHSWWNSGYTAIHLGIEKITSTGVVVYNRGSALNNSGTILGAVKFENGSDALDNSGTIRGAVDMGAGSDGVTNTGTLYGALTLGAGRDAVDNTLGRITSTVDLGDGYDEFYGGNAADRVIGGRGDDFIELGAGKDIYFATAGDGEDTVDAGSGVDTYNLSLLTTAARFNLSEPDSAAFGYDSVTGFENLVGTGLADTLTGTEAANSIWGGAGADRLIGLGGNDSYYVETTTDVVVEAAGGGTDQIVTTGSYTLAAGSAVERLLTSNPESIAALLLKGNEFSNVIIGNAGANRIWGMGGDDTLRGKAGNDIYYVDGANDRVLESADEGTDQVITSVSYTLAAGSAIETLNTSNSAATTALALTGNELRNTITGNAGANVITGGLGGDGLNGGGGADRYEFNSVAESTTMADGVISTAGRDTITWGTGDLIDLSTIDANPAVAGNQAFTFIGSAAFTAPGQLRAQKYSVSGRDFTNVEANTEGTSGAEMTILINTSATIVSSDFIL